MSERSHENARVGTEANGLRLDRFLAEELELFPRSQIRSREVDVRVDGTAAKLSRRVRAGELVEVSWSEPAGSRIEPEPMELDILFENDDVVVINKQAGMVVHPAAGNWTGTLVQGLMHHVSSLADRFDSDARPGIVHRLDKETSGVIIAAKHPAALAELAAQFKRRATAKRYLAIVKGAPRPESGTVELPIGRDPKHRKRYAVVEGGREALTRYRILRRWSSYSLVSLEPQTGRTHQLRVHMAALGCPIAGDPVYSRSDPRLCGARLALHAVRLRIRLPDESEPRTFTARIPADFRATLRRVSTLP